MARTARGPFRHIFSAISSAVDITWSAATTLLIRPVLCASCASILPPVSSNSIAMHMGIALGSLSIPPPLGMIPHRTSCRPNCACSAATLMSQLSAISSPSCYTEAVYRSDGRVLQCTSRTCSAYQVDYPLSNAPLHASGPSFATSLRSCPVQNARSPDPVMIITHTSGSSSSALHVLASCCQCASVSAFKYLRPVQGHVGYAALSSQPTSGTLCLRSCSVPRVS